MGQRILFLTGKLAYPSLSRVLAGMPSRDFTYRVHDLGLSVAALMTESMIKRRLKDIGDVDRIVVPGLCGGPVEDLSQHFGIPVQRGPKDLKDLPEYFGRSGVKPDLSTYSVNIFAEIVEAPKLSVDQILACAADYRESGADVIDLGCLPGISFPHLEEAIQALHEKGFKVSLDSLENQELLRAGRAGADYLLSLRESTLWIAQEVPAVPVLIPQAAGDLDSLCRATESLRRQDRAFLADAILDPIHFGFTASLARFYELRRRLPDAPLFMGTGNVTELTDGDTTGISALLMGIASELDVSAILTTQVSPHARTAVREADIGRRIMYAAKRDSSLPRGYDNGLMALRDRKPYPHSPEEISQTARAIRDPSFRVQISEHGIHVFNRNGMHVAKEPFALFRSLDVEHDGAHAFYLGVELARAQIAWELGKRYVQDERLAWGCAVPEDTAAHTHHAPDSTRRTRRSKG